MSDEEAEKLLQLLAKYAEENGSNLTVSELAEDLAMSMDVTSDKADHYRRIIEGGL